MCIDRFQVFASGEAGVCGYVLGEAGVHAGDALKQRRGHW